MLFLLAKKYGEPAYLRLLSIKDTVLAAHDVRLFNDSHFVTQVIIPLDFAHTDSPSATKMASASGGIAPELHRGQNRRLPNDEYEEQALQPLCIRARSPSWRNWGRVWGRLKYKYM